MGNLLGPALQQASVCGMIGWSISDVFAKDDVEPKRKSCREILRDHMLQKSDVLQIRARQVGILMRHYRTSFPVEDGQTGLTMEAVLERMSRINQRYEGSAPSTLSRWESGQVMPRKARLQEFGAALNLSQAEIDGLIALAGIDERDPPDPAHDTEIALASHEDASVSTSGSGPVSGRADTWSEPGVRPFLIETMKTGFLQFLLPGLAIAGAGYLLSSLGITTAWILIPYIGVAMGLVVLQGFLRKRRTDSLRDLLFVSLFVVLSAPLMQIPFVHTDHYGLYMLAGPDDGAKLILIALSGCLSMALIASLAFDLLWRWQYSGRGARQAHHRAVWVVSPPIAFVYLCILLLGPLGAWIEYLFILGVLAGVFITLLLLKDPTVRLSVWDQRFLLWSASMTILVLIAVAGATILVTYSELSMLTTKGHSLLHSWEADYRAWGYSDTEWEDRTAVGFVWNAVAVVAYMVIVIGGNLISAIYRLDTTDAGTPTADIGELPKSATTQRTSRTGSIKSLFGPGRLAGNPISSRAG